jgi:para-aminobenzoate synthetase component I
LKSIRKYSIEKGFFEQALYWAMGYKHAVVLNDFHTKHSLGGFPNRIAVSNAPEAVYHKSLIQKGKEYYGHITYDFKNHIEDLSSHNTNLIDFPDFFFFEPEVCLEFLSDGLVLTASDPDGIFNMISGMCPTKTSFVPAYLESLTAKAQYLQNMEDLICHIQKGDVYELNYCLAFSAKMACMDPVHLYRSLTSYSAMPFSCMVKCKEQYLVCASPERYFSLKGQNVLSQPIKGTARVKDLANTQQEMLQLHQSAKERNENVMIVDLVRNDLSKICEAGSVKVTELYGVYQFDRIYQMISTVTGLLPQGKSWLDVVEATFPMGSMTGAPKYKAMQLIEAYEDFRRNIYSGTVGFISSDGDADFNVVIRSIFYDGVSNTVSFAVGSGITAMSNPEQEYEECLLKAENIIRVLSAPIL